MPIVKMKRLQVLALERDHRRVERTLEAYETLRDWYGRYLLSRDGRMAVEVFDTVYPETGFSDMKKVDFVIWSILWS